MTIIAGLKALPANLEYFHRVIKCYAIFRAAEKKNQNIGKIFDVYANKNPNKVCFYFEDEKWTFKRVQETSNRIGNYFAKEGLKKKDIVSLFMEGRPEYISTWLGLSRIGVIPALINTNQRADSLKHSIKVANSKAIIYGYELSDAIDELYPGGNYEMPLYGSGNSKNSSRKIIEGSRNIETNLEQTSAETPAPQNDLTMHDELFYIYTSGTTGLPKAAVIKHARLLTMTLAGTTLGGIKENDILYTTLPLYHSAGGGLGIGSSLVFGTSIAIRSKFSASNFWKDCIKYNATAAQYMGELCRYLLRAPVHPEEKQHKVRLMIGNGLRAEIWNDFVTRFNIPQISEFYGSTEGNANLLNYKNRVGAAGFVPPFVANMFPLAIIKLNDQGDPVRDPKTGIVVKCGPGEQGELVAKIIKNHPFRDFKGYAADQSATKKKVVENAFEQGDIAFRTGDLFEKDADGYYYFKDRMGDTFRWKGENVSTSEVEYVISNLVGLKDCVVYGISIPGSDGKAGMAALADENGTLDIKSLYGKLSKSLPSYARPLFIRVMAELEMTGTHKMKKTDLQKEGFTLPPGSKDKLYFLKDSEYQLVDKELFDKLSTGQMNL